MESYKKCGFYHGDRHVVVATDSRVSHIVKQKALAPAGFCVPHCFISAFQHLHTFTRTHAHTHARTHARTHASKYTNQQMHTSRPPPAHSQLLFLLCQVRVFDGETLAGRDKLKLTMPSGLHFNSDATKFAVTSGYAAKTHVSTTAVIAAHKPHAAHGHLAWLSFPHSPTSASRLPASMHHTTGVSVIRCWKA